MDNYPSLESRGCGCRDPSRWPRGKFYPQKLALTSPTNGGHSVGTVRLRTQATDPAFLFFKFLGNYPCPRVRFGPRDSKLAHSKAATGLISSRSPCSALMLLQQYFKFSLKRLNYEFLSLQPSWAEKTLITYNLLWENRNGSSFRVAMLKIQIETRQTNLSTKPDSRNPSYVATDDQSVCDGAQPF
jgi:hypothetical protein